MKSQSVLATDSELIYTEIQRTNRKNLQLIFGIYYAWWSMPAIPSASTRTSQTGGCHIIFPMLYRFWPQHIPHTDEVWLTHTEGMLHYMPNAQICIWPQHVRHTDPSCASHQGHNKCSKSNVYIIPTSRQAIEMKQDINCSSESVLCSVPRFSMQCLSSLIKCCQRWTSFLNLSV